MPKEETLLVGCAYEPDRHVADGADEPQGLRRIITRSSRQVEAQLLGRSPVCSNNVCGLSNFTCLQVEHLFNRRLLDAEVVRAKEVGDSWHILTGAHHEVALYHEACRRNCCGHPVILEEFQDFHFGVQPAPPQPLRPS